MYEKDKTQSDCLNTYITYVMSPLRYGQTIKQLKPRNLTHLRSQRQDLVSLFDLSDVCKNLAKFFFKCEKAVGEGVWSGIKIHKKVFKF